LFSPLGTTVNQFGAARFQAVQKPLALIFQVPKLLLPACSRGSRLIFPSGVKKTYGGERLSVKEGRLDVCRRYRLGSYCRGTANIILAKINIVSWVKPTVQ